MHKDWGANPGSRGDIYNPMGDGSAFNHLRGSAAHYALMIGVRQSAHAVVKIFNIFVGYIFLIYA